MTLERELLEIFKEFLTNAFGVQVKNGVRKGELCRGMVKGRFFLIREWDETIPDVPTVEVFCADNAFLEQLQNQFWGTVQQEVAKEEAEGDDGEFADS